MKKYCTRKGLSSGEKQWFEVLMNTLLLILKSVVCSPLSVRYSVVEMTAIIISSSKSPAHFTCVNVKKPSSKVRWNKQVVHTYSCVWVRRVSVVQPVERHEGDFTSQSQTVHLLQDSRAGFVCVHYVMEQPDQKSWLVSNWILMARHTAESPRDNQSLSQANSHFRTLSFS